MARHLIINLESPFMAFGGETIDNLGVIRPFPAASMITGLLANALGWRRVDRQRHQDLQDQMVFAARIDREPHGGLSTRDFQTAQLAAKDKGWTTRGAPEERAGGANTYNAPHLRYRDYYADMRVTVALRLEPIDGGLTLDRLAEALQEPARPLFIGRKPCLPSSRLFARFRDGDTSLAALLAHPLRDEKPSRDPVRTLWPAEEGSPEIEASRTYMLTDQRNWISGLHGGGRWVCQGAIDRDKFASDVEAASPEKEEQT